MPENLFEPGCIRTYSGQYINLGNPDPATIYPIDIAVALSRECRFANHTKKAYTVAEHSLNCVRYAEANYPDDKYLPFKVLLHDAHEYVWRDLPSPIKQMLPDYKEYADLLQAAIHERFGVRISHEEKEKIKQIDEHMLQWEWENKKLKWMGLWLDEKTLIELFLHDFQRLCKVPYVIFPS